MATTVKRDLIWIYFKEIRTEEMKGSRAKCKFCDKELEEAQVQRVKYHFDSCLVVTRSEEDDESQTAGSTVINRKYSSFSESKISKLTAFEWCKSLQAQLDNYF